MCYTKEAEFSLTDHNFLVVTVEPSEIYSVRNNGINIFEFLIQFLKIAVLEMNSSFIFTLH